MFGIFGGKSSVEDFPKSSPQLGEPLGEYLVINLCVGKNMLSKSLILKLPLKLDQEAVPYKSSFRENLHLILPGKMIWSKICEKNYLLKSTFQEGLSIEESYFREGLFLCGSIKTWLALPRRPILKRVLLWRLIFMEQPPGSIGWPIGSFEVYTY